MRRREASTSPIVERSRKAQEVQGCGAGTWLLACSNREDRMGASGRDFVCFFVVLLIFLIVLFKVMNGI